MNKQSVSLMNIIHAVLTAVFCAAVMLMNRMSPLTILPKLTMPLMLLLLLAALVIETYVKGVVRDRNALVAICIAAAVFTVLPFLFGGTGGAPLWKTAVGGLIVAAFGIPVYDAVLERTFADGEKHLLAPLANALMLFLASQALYHIF